MCFLKFFFIELHISFKVHFYMRELWFSYVDLSLKCVDLVLFGFYVLLC